MVAVSLVCSILQSLSILIFLSGLPLVYFLLRFEEVSVVRRLRPRRCVIAFASYGLFLLYMTLISVTLRPQQRLVHQSRLAVEQEIGKEQWGSGQRLSSVGVSSSILHCITDNMIFHFIAPLCPLLHFTPSPQRSSARERLREHGNYPHSAWLPVSSTVLFVVSLIEVMAFAVLMGSEAVHGLSMWRSAIRAVPSSLLEQKQKEVLSLSVRNEPNRQKAVKRRRRLLGLLGSSSTPGSTSSASSSYLHDTDGNELDVSSSSGLHHGRSSGYPPISSQSSRNLGSESPFGMSPHGGPTDYRQAFNNNRDGISDINSTRTSSKSNPLSDESPSFFGRFSNQLTRSFIQRRTEKAPGDDSVGDSSAVKSPGLMSSRIAHRLSQFATSPETNEDTKEEKAKEEEEEEAVDRVPVLTPKKWYTMTSLFWLPNSVVYVTLAIPFTVVWLYLNVVSTVSRVLLPMIVREGEQLTNQPLLVQQLAGMEAQYIRLLHASHPTTTVQPLLVVTDSPPYTALHPLSTALSWCFCPSVIGYYALIALVEINVIRFLYQKYVLQLKVFQEVLSKSEVKEPQLHFSLLVIVLLALVLLQGGEVGNPLLWQGCMLLCSMAATGSLLARCYGPYQFIRNEYVKVTGRTAREVFFSRSFKPFRLKDKGLGSSLPTLATPVPVGDPPIVAGSQREQGLPGFLSVTENSTPSLGATVADPNSSSGKQNTVSTAPVEELDPVVFWQNIAEDALASGATVDESPLPLNKSTSPSSESFVGSFSFPSGSPPSALMIGQQLNTAESETSGNISSSNVVNRHRQNPDRDNTFRGIRDSVLLTAPPVPGSSEVQQLPIHGNNSFVSTTVSTTTGTLFSGTTSSGSTTEAVSANAERPDAVTVPPDALMVDVVNPSRPIDLHQMKQDDNGSVHSFDKSTTGSVDTNNAPATVDEDDGFYNFIEQIYKCKDEVSQLQPLLHPHGVRYVREKVDEEGYTLLHHAVQSASINVIRFLLELGADPDVRNANGLTPLHLAVTSRAEAERVFADTKLATTDTVEGDIPSIKKGRGRRSYYAYLHSSPSGSTRYGRITQISIVTALLSGGASVDYPTFECQTALHLAVRLDEIGVLNTLLRAGANPWIEFSTEDIKKTSYLPTWPVVHLLHAGEAWGERLKVNDDDDSPLPAVAVTAPGQRKSLTSHVVSSGSLRFYKSPMMLAVELGNEIAVESMLHVLDIQLLERYIEVKARKESSPTPSVAYGAECRATSDIHSVESSLAPPSVLSGTQIMDRTPGTASLHSNHTDFQSIFSEGSHVRLLSLPRCGHRLTFLKVALALGHAEVALTLLRKKLEEISSAQLMEFELFCNEPEAELPSISSRESVSSSDGDSGVERCSGSHGFNRRLGNVFHYTAIGNSTECLAYILDAFEIPDILQPCFMEQNGGNRTLTLFASKDGTLGTFAPTQYTREALGKAVPDSSYLASTMVGVSMMAQCESSSTDSKDRSPNSDSPLHHHRLEQQYYPNHTLLKAAETEVDSKRNYIKNFLTEVAVCRQQQIANSLLGLSNHAVAAAGGGGTSTLGGSKVALSVQLPKALSSDGTTHTYYTREGSSPNTTKDDADAAVTSKLFYNTKVNNPFPHSILSRPNVQDNRRVEATAAASSSPPAVRARKGNSGCSVKRVRRRVSTTPPLTFLKAIAVLRVQLPGFPIDLAHLNTLEAAVDALCGGGERVKFTSIDRLLALVKGDDVAPSVNDGDRSSDGPCSPTLTLAEQKELQQALLRVSRRLRLNKLTTALENLSTPTHKKTSRKINPGRVVRAIHRCAQPGPSIATRRAVSELSFSDSSAESSNSAGEGKVTVPDASVGSNLELSGSSHSFNSPVSITREWGGRKVFQAAEVLRKMETIETALNDLDENRLTPLHYAIMNRNPNLIFVLCAYGAQFSFASPESKEILTHQEDVSLLPREEKKDLVGSSNPANASVNSDVFNIDVTLQPHPLGSDSPTIDSPVDPEGQPTTSPHASTTDCESSHLGEASAVLSSPDMKPVDFALGAGSKDSAEDITLKDNLKLFKGEEVTLDSFLDEAKVTSLTSVPEGEDKKMGSPKTGTDIGKPPLSAPTAALSSNQQGSAPLNTSNKLSLSVLNRLKQYVEEKADLLFTLSEQSLRQLPQHVIEALDVAAAKGSAMHFLCSIESNRNTILFTLRHHHSPSPSSGNRQSTPSRGPPSPDDLHASRLKSPLSPDQEIASPSSLHTGDSLSHRQLDYEYFHSRTLEPHDLFLLHTCCEGGNSEILLRAATAGTALHQNVMDYLRKAAKEN